MGILGAVISAVGFGMANVAIKKALSDLKIVQLLTMSTFTGVGGLVLLNLLRGTLTAPSITDLLISVIFATFEVLLYMVLFKTFEVCNVTIATAISSGYPIISMLFAVFILGEYISSAKMLFVVLMVFGVLLIGIKWEDVFKDGFDKGDLVKGIKWILVNTLILSIYFPLFGKYTETGSWEYKLLLVKIFSGVIMLVVFHGIRKEKILPGNKKLLPIASLVGILEIIGWIGYSWASNHSEGQIGIIIAILNSSTMVTAIAAYFILKERLSAIQYAGVVVTVFALIGLGM